MLTVLVSIIRGGSRTAATSKSSILDVAAVLDPPLIIVKHLLKFDFTKVNLKLVFLCTEMRLKRCEVSFNLILIPAVNLQWGTSSSISPNKILV